MLNRNPGKSILVLPELVFWCCAPCEGDEGITGVCHDGVADLDEVAEVVEEDVVEQEGPEARHRLPGHDPAAEGRRKDRVPAKVPPDVHDQVAALAALGQSLQWRAKRDVKTRQEPVSCSHGGNQWPGKQTEGMERGEGLKGRLMEQEGEAERTRYQT